AHHLHHPFPTRRSSDLPYPPGRCINSTVHCRYRLTFIEIDGMPKNLIPSLMPDWIRIFVGTQSGPNPDGPIRDLRYFEPGGKKHLWGFRISFPWPFPCLPKRDREECKAEFF